MDANIRERLLNEIWLEKYSRVNIRPPAILFISLDSPKINTTHLIKNIIDTLSLNVNLSYEWSRTWGATRVCVRPNIINSCEFAPRDYRIRRDYCLVRSSKQSSPENFLKESHSSGTFELILNKCPLTIEGVVLQLERMVDELIWQIHLELIERKSLDNAIAYQNAIEIAKKQSIGIRYDEEAVILQKRLDNPKLPIRMYGDFLKLGKLPPIIGAVSLSGLEITKSYSINIASQAKKNTKERRFVFNIQANSTTPQKLNLLNSGSNLDKKTTKKLESKENQEIIICWGITPTKHLHAGHLLLLAVVEIYRRGIGTHKTFLDINDTGPRIAGTLAQASSELNIPIGRTLLQLVKDANIEQLHSWYKNRIMSGESFSRAKTFLNSQNSTIFSKAISTFNTFLNDVLDLQIEIIPESECQEQYYKLIDEVAVPEWRTTGFEFSHLVDRVIVLEQEGIPTSTAMRSAFLLKASQKSVDASIFANQPHIYFVDSDWSIADSCKLLNKSLHISQIEGAAIGSHLNMLSGSFSDTTSAQEIFEIFKDHTKFSLNIKTQDVFLSTLVYYLLTRYTTSFTPGNRGLVFGNSFYDYYSDKNFVADLIQCESELSEFLKGIRELKRTIREKWKAQDDELVFGKTTLAQRNDFMYDLSSHNLQKISINSKFLIDAKIMRLDNSFLRVRQRLNKFFLLQNIQADDIDRLILNGLKDGIKTERELLSSIADTLGYNTLIELGSPVKIIHCSYLLHSFSRGYTGKAMVDNAMEYVQGRAFLLLRRSPYLELLHKLIIIDNYVLQYNKLTLDNVLGNIDIAISRLGFEKLLNL